MGWPVAMVLGVALLGAACGDDPAVGGDEGSDGPVDVALGDTELGEILVDGDGMTLYLFTEDPPGDSVCVDECLAVWPPLLIDGEPRVGDGIDASLVGTIERPDDGVQLTYDGAPLYTWASDQQPGDVTGQGVQVVWFVVAPDGSAVTDTEAGGPDETTEDEQETGPDY